MPNKPIRKVAGMIKVEPRLSAFTELADYDFLSAENAFMEITEWGNGEGFDVTVDSHSLRNISLTWGEFKALKKLVKALDSADHSQNGVQNEG